MASVKDAVVTINRDYFEKLVRRANLNSEPVPPSSTIPVSPSEYDGLKQIARQYANLRQNLLRGGVGEETIVLLSQDDATIQKEKQPSQSETIDKDSEGGARLKFPASPKPVKHDTPKRQSNGNGYGGHHSHGVTRQHDSQDWADADADGDGLPDDASFSLDAPAEGHDILFMNGQPPSRPQFDRQCNRTIQLLNLPEGTTHGDITAVVRGGLLLDIFVRAHDRSATVSFLRENEARYFYAHVKKHDLYIKNKRVDFRWNDRQFTLAGHVANKIGIGASRNLVIRRVDSKLTEEIIRDDLEHIHNLAVIHIRFIGGSCYISTNSVHNAMFARTCMMSRAKYKGSKIDWDVDECAQPYDRVATFKTKKEQAPQRKASTSMANRFQLLNVDDEEEEDDIKPSFPRAENTVGIAA